MKVIYDEQHEFWTGQGYIVIDDDGEPPIAFFDNVKDALDYIAGEACETSCEPMANGFAGAGSSPQLKEDTYRTASLRGRAGHQQ